MAKTTSKRQYRLFLGLLLLAALKTTNIHAACGKITPSFTYSKNKSCGVPVTVTFTNTSTGASQNVATYKWYVGSSLFKTSVGKASASYTINAPGTYTIKLVAKDTGSVGCQDSSSTTITISANSPKIKDPNGVFTYNPIWENCISNSTAPDTFGLKFEVNDSLKNYIIKWGDGSSNAAGSLLLKSQSLYHKYSTLGQFKVTIVTTNGSCTDTLIGSVINERTPVAGLIGPPTGTNQGCVPLKVRFINNSVQSSPSTTFTWDMGDGTVYTFGSTSYKDTLYHTYKRYKCNGTITLTALNACGSSFSTWNPIQASSKDTSIPKLSNPNNCNLATAFQFDNLSASRYCGSPNPRKYMWLWGDGTNSGWTTSTATQTKKYNSRGSYTVRLIDSNACGKDTGIFILKIDSLPTANASGAPLSGCSPLVVSFKDNSSSNATSRLWNWGDGTPTNTFVSPTHTYTSGGNYNAILAVSNNCGTVYDTLKITVKQKVIAKFANINTGCSPLTVKFTNQSVQGLAGVPKYKWDFGDGTTSTATTPPDKTYTALSNYTVTLIATDSCGSDTFKQTFTVRGKPSASVTVTSTNNCAGAGVNFDLVTSPVNSATVIYGDGTPNSFYFGLGGIINKSLSHKYDSAKTYKMAVYVVDPSGCNDTNFFNIKVNPSPTIKFTSNVSAGCGPLNVTFTNTSVHNGGGTIGQMKFVWDYKNGVKSYGIDSVAKFNFFKTRDSIYNVKLVGTNSFGCKDSTNRGIRVYPKPLSKFTLSKADGCAPLILTTTNNSIPYDTGSIAIMKFVWNFANGKIAYAQDTAAKFLASKTKDTIYNVSLVAISEHGCLDTSYNSVRIYPKPKAAFLPSATQGCGPLKIDFTNQSTPFDTGSLSIMGFNWDFGNRITSNLAHPNSTYNDVLDRDTTYKVRLIVTSEHGCLDTSFTNILLHPKPRILFDMSATNGCGPLPVSFTNKTINGTKWSWQFGVYGTDTAKNPSKLFYGRSIFDSIVVVRLSSVSVFGCKSDTLINKVVVNGVPIANYLVSKDTFCFPDQMQFLNQSLAAYNYKWDLGDGTITNTTNPKHFFKKSSSPFKDTTYYIKLIATSPYGCKDTARGTMTVLPYPIPKFTIDNSKGCAPHTVNFTNLSVNVKKYFWVFGDGFTSTLVNPSHVYINSGPNDTAYKATLYTYSVDCIDSISIWIPVYKPAYSFFRTDRVNPCDAGYFQFTSFAENATTLLYNFGDGSNSAMTNPLHLFPTSPYSDTSYTVKLIATSGRGCTDSFNRVVTLPQRLRLGMKDTGWALCAPAIVPFKNYTQGAITYIWDFGDNTGSSQRDPIHDFQKPGVYNYKLYAYDANGCIDSMVSVSKIRVDISPTADFDFNPGKGRMPNDNRIFFTDKSRSTIPITYQWDFSDPNGNPPTSTLQNPAHDFSDSGNYKICLVVNNGGCTDTFCNTVRIEPPFPTPDFTVDRDSGCPPLTVQFTNISTNADRYIWFFGDGDRSDDKDPVHTYKYSGYYDVTLVAKGPGGEGKTEKKYFIKVLNAPYTYFDATPSVMYLPNAIFNTRNLTTGAVSYQWNVYNNRSKVIVGTSTKKNPYFQVYDTGSYDIELISMSNQGCFDTLLLLKPVLVSPTGFMHIPDAFTPTKDDKNETFKPVVTNVSKQHYIFQIFNRWGEILYETRDPDAGWDGTKNNKLCPDGVYVYKIKAKLYNGDDIARDGIVHLLR